ncbi:putative cupin 2 domain-containing protein [Daldinia childiae]|uniref:putative cupin 2 domain-containing protein n=1 Tax=Daldinia childiae TaxID=326645 RepID=UPI00144763E4|nr:putative cupin 2 domain-containing protein [Daldinia childiae]KAF3061436.1 putative cupin 2 domain-containing protein [Daldinia childiae]
MTSDVTPPSGVRVVVTAHDEEGTSIVHSDQIHEPFMPFGLGGSSFSIFDTRSSVPINNKGEPQYLQNTIPRPEPAGVTFCIANLAPHHSSPMHRTLSLDYCAVLSGEIVLELDGGEERTIKTGEVVVQQGANHVWHNRTDEVCRIVFVMVGAEKIKLSNGQELRETPIGNSSNSCLDSLEERVYA